MTVRSKGGLLVGAAVAFVLVWELRSLLGMTLGVDVGVVPYVVVSTVAVAAIVVALSLRDPPAEEAQTGSAKE